MHINTWHEAIAHFEQQGRGYVLVTVLQSAGSTPRDAGSKMVISDDSQYDTIGGGHLEYEAISSARKLLAKGESCQEVASFPLSSKLGQCCGGAVKLLYEVMLNHQQHLAIFGAGHVAQALVPILAQLPLQITWVDSRENFFNEDSAGDKVLKAIEAQQSPHGNVAIKARSIAASLSNVYPIANDEPCEVLESLPPSAWVIILTHNHQLDYELVETALKNASLDFVGMIGSATKAKRFVTKLAHRGFTSAQIERLVSPIGLLNIAGKRPVEVAVSISAQLINLLNKDLQKGTYEAEVFQPSLTDSASATPPSEKQQTAKPIMDKKQ